MDKDRRAAERIDTSIPIELEVVGEPLGVSDAWGGDPLERTAFSSKARGATITGEIKDISINGARVACSTPPPVLSRVQVRFSLPELGKTEGVGLVMWRRTVPHEFFAQGKKMMREAGLGIVFVSLSLEARTAIARLVSGAQ